MQRQKRRLPPKTRKGKSMKTSEIGQLGDNEWDELAKTRTKMTTEDMKTETLALLDYLERRGLNERDAVGVLGSTLTSLINSPEAVAQFADVLFRTVMSKPGKENT
jgi:hypothetical protein